MVGAPLVGALVVAPVYMVGHNHKLVHTAETKLAGRPALRREYAYHHCPKTPSATRTTAWWIDRRCRYTKVFFTRHPPDSWVAYAPQCLKLPPLRAPFPPTPTPRPVGPKRNPALTRNSPGKRAYWSITMGASGEGYKRAVLVSAVEEAKT